MNILLAGSDSMEFGWLIACWVPYVRYHVWHGKYDAVIIVGRKGNECLYKDFATEFIPYHVDGETDMWRVNGKAAGVPEEMRRKFIGDNITVLEPSADIINPDKKFYWYYG